MTHHIDTPHPYRWVIVASASVILAVVMGQLVNGLSVYFVPLEASFGWTRGDIALINTAGLAGIALGGIVMGRLADRFPIRPIALLGVAVAGLAGVAASQATALWQLYILYFLAGALGGGAVFAPLMALVGSWFTRGAGLAIGIASAGQAMGQGGMPFTGALLIETLGWRGAMAAQGLGTLVLLLPLALLLRNPPATPGAGAVVSGGVDGLSNRAVTVWLSAAIFFCCTCMAVPLMHLVPYLQACGIPVTDAGGVLFFMLIIAIAGRVAFGRYADMVGALPAYFTASLWQTALVFGFTGLVTLEMLYPYAAIYGFGYAGVMTTVLVTARTLTEPSRRASSMGIILAFGWFGHGFGGWQGGFLFDLTGSYSATFAVAAIAGAVNLALVGALWVRVSRRRAGIAAFA
ncbi:MAG: MFS transporter [Pseudomonadota bacterium]